MTFAILVTLAGSMTMSARYSTLTEISDALNQAGTKTVVSPTVAEKVYGVCLDKADPQQVLSALKGDESLSVANEKGVWRIEAASDMKTTYDQERSSFAKALSSSIESIYKVADRELQSLHQIRDYDARSVEEISRLNAIGSRFKTQDYLIYDSQRYQDTLRYPMIRIPLLAAPLLSSTGSNRSQVSNFASIIGSVMPMEQQTPLVDSHTKNTFFGMVLGPSTEPLAAKMERLRGYRTQVSAKWDPQDLRAACCLDFESTWSTLEGKPYEGRYLIDAVHSGLADSRETRTIRKADFLMPKHLAKVEAAISQTEVRLKTDPHWTREVTWPTGKALLSDCLLEGARMNHLNLIFPISHFHNVQIDRVPKESLAGLITRSMTRDVYSADAARNSLARLGVPRFLSNWDPLVTPSWIEWRSGSIVSLATDLRCMDSVPGSPLLDIDLANARLNKEPISLVKVLDALAKVKSSNLVSLSPNEALSWCHPLALRPFALLVSKSTRIRDAVGSKSTRFRPTPDEVKVLTSALFEIDPLYDPDTATPRAQVAAGRLLNEAPSEISLVVSSTTEKKCQFTLVWSGERIWGASITLP